MAGADRHSSYRRTRTSHALSFGLAVAATLAGADAALATSTSEARRAAAEAIAALKAGEYDDALDGLREAEVMLPDMPELIYNQAVAEYRLGNYDAAREHFNRALVTRDLDLEQRIKFNLGNCAYAEALERLTDLPGAIEKARVAISHYQDALELDPLDNDARANIETANLLIRDLLDKKKKEEEEKQQQQQPQQNQTSQPSEDQQQQQQQQSQQGEQPPEEQPQQGENESEQPEQPEQQGQPQPQPSPDEQEQEDGNEEQQQGQGRPEPQERREMSKEEADRLLQAVRDKERERREELRRRAIIGQPPVERDW
jgi:Ca-activated chloride channel family protein